MPQCPKCGTETTGAFCGQCGAPIAAQAGGTGATAGPAGSYAGGAAGPLSINVAAALCYLLGPITGVLFLVMAPYSSDRRIRFHAYQSIVFFVAYFVAGMALGVVFSMISLVFPDRMIALAFSAYRLAGLLVWAFLMWQAYQGNEYELPVVGSFARKYV